MSRRLVFVFAAGMALGGCCLGSGCYIQPPTGALASWDGLGSPPRRFPAKVVRVKAQTPSPTVASAQNAPGEAELAMLKPYSKEWTVMLNAINRAADDELRKRLIICRGCMPVEQEDRTGTIADDGYLPGRHERSDPAIGAN
jgi:hypothetical protein